MLGFGVLAACTPAPTDFDKAVAAYRDNRFADARPLIIAEANAGNRDAMAMAGSMLVMGQGGARDSAEGVRWLRKAVEAGNSNAQMMLGTLYTFGTGVPQDAAEARHWLGLAAKQGDGKAAVLLNKLNGKTEKAM